MCSVGDKVVCAHHGAGTIVAIEHKEVLGRPCEYFSICMFHDRMTMMIPVENAERSGMRKVIAADAVDEVLCILRAGPSEGLSTKWHERTKRMQEKLGTGEVCAVAEVVRDIHRRGDLGALPLGDKRLLEKASKILIGELMCACDLDEAGATALLDEALNGESRESR